MTTIEFYSTLHGLNIRLWLVGDRLHYAAPEGVLTPSLREELKKRKPELVVFLRDVAVALGQASTSIPHTARDKSLPLSFGQERLWFLDQSRPGLSTYNNPIALRLTGQLRVSALEASVNEIVRRHEVLRTSFVVVDEQPTQVIAPKLEFKLPVIDLSGVADIERETETRRLVTQEAQRPFDLGCGPLIRARLLRLGETEHVLILDMHHIVSDGWSMGVFFQELATLYNAFSKGEISPLTELSIQYADFSVWQREWLQGKELEKQLSYWKERMRASLPVLELPADRSRPAAATYTGSTQTFVLPDELSRTLKALSQEQGVTLYMLLLAAFKVLLMRYSGQTDIIVGSPISNRVHRELEGLIGFFVNNLVLRTDLAGDPSFVELLRRVREVCLGAYAHPDLPFEKLVQELHLERNMSYNPLFQVMFVLQNAPIGGLEIPGMSISTVEVENRTAKFDLTLTMLETGQGLAGRLEYTTDIFEPATIVRLLHHFQILLEGIAANPAQLLSELPLMDEAELHQMLIEWNDTKVQYPREKCIHVLFEEQVERTPDTVAVIFEKQKLTYREVNERANQIAHYLRKLGAGPEVPVGLFLERCADLVVAILGILKSGSLYVPLDTLYPLERRAEIIRNSGLKILVTQEALGTGEHENDLVLLCLDKQQSLLAAEDKQNPIQVNKPENLVYIIYTSGSTGKPNGVEISHRSLVNCLLSANQRIGLSAGNLSIAVFTPTFDVSVFDFLGPLCLGATVVVASREEVYDSALLAKKIMDLPVTWMSAAPSTWRMLLETGWQGKTGLKVISTGEALQSDLANRLIKINLEVYNLYGPTETTIWCASKRLTSAENVTIGRPIANTKLYILDSHLKPVPVGVTGELYIGGDGLARGYHNLPELTAEKFIPDPFRNEPGMRLFASGDLARFKENGEIDLLGRIDKQVKIRGYRIELGEIEAAIEQCPEVGQALIMVREDQPGDRRLVAYIVPTLNARLDTDNLRGFLRANLPSYMIPAAFVQLEALPLTTNGKIDIKALPAPGMSKLVNNEYIAPRSQTEQILSKIWMDVLRTPRVSVQDSFFDAGGDSLLAIQTIARIQNKFEMSMPIQRIFEFPRLSDLAAQIDFILFLQEQGSGLQKSGNDRKEYIV